MKFYKKVNFWKEKYEVELKSDLEDLYNNVITQAIVFNDHLLNANPSKIKYILVGDNPGIEEQMNGSYLYGTAGKKVREFFTETGLVTDFEEEVLIFNKTPLFTKRTKHLNNFYVEGFSDFLIESQEFMAQLVFDIHFKKKDIQVWILGFAGCRETNGEWLKIQQNGTHYYEHQLLPYFFEELKACYHGRDIDFKVFKHFSFDHFFKDINGYEEMDLEVLIKSLDTVGESYRNELMPI